MRILHLLLYFTFVSWVHSYDATSETFYPALKEKQVDWIFHSDDYKYLRWSRKFITAGVSYITKLRSVNEYIDTYKNNYEEECKHVILVRFCKNSSSFFESLEQLSELETIYFRTNDWNKPIYFIVWPEKINSLEKAEILIKNKIIDSIPTNRLIDNNIYIVIPIQKSNTKSYKLSIWETYSIDKNHSIYNIVNTMGWYDLTNKMNRRGNFQGAIIRVMSMDDPNYSINVRFKNKTTGPPEFENGTAIGLLNFMMDRLNFTVSAVRGTVTVENINGDLTGGVIEMENDIADLCISQTPMTNKREQHIHFLQPIFLDPLRAFFIQPKASQYRDIYYKSFSNNVWLALVSIWIIMIITMHGFTWIKNRYTGNELLDIEILNESFLWALGAVCQQGWHKQPSSFSMRLIFLIGYLTGVVCFVAFSASIVSNLSIKIDSIRTIRNLVQGEFKMYVLEYSTAGVYLDKLLKSQKSKFEYTVNQSTALSYLMKNNYALITYPVSFNILTSSQPEYTSQFLCEKFSSIPLKRGPVQSAMMVQKDSPFTEFFNYQIIIMRERGINHRFMVQYVRATHPICLDFNNAYTQSLEMVDVQTAFIILASGYVLSLFFLGIEKIWKSFKANVNVEVYLS